MRAIAICIIIELALIGTYLHADAITSKKKRPPISAVEKFVSSGFYCQQLLGDQGSGDVLSAEFSNRLDAALNDIKKPTSVAMKEIHSLCEKSQHGMKHAS